ncbi:MAG: DUF998 domain-containing protein [Candidatus Hermodarchaeota archaeon]
MQDQNFNWSISPRETLKFIPGIITPILYIGLIIILGALEPGYNHLTTMMSVLGGVEGIRGVIFNIGVALMGILIILFAIVLQKNINEGKGSKIATILFILGGLGLIGAAIFHCNQDCTNVIERDITGILHMISAFISGMSLAIAPLFVYFRLKKDPQWQKYAGYTLATFIASNIPGITLWVTYLTGNRIRELEGLIQRLGIVFVLIWIGVISVQMLVWNLNISQDVKL